MKQVVLAVLLSGCASNFSASKPPVIVYPQFHFTIYERPEQLAPNVNGTATLVDFVGSRMCVVNLRKYPRCLLHEIRHCIEGHWHDPDVPNSEDC